MYCTQQSSNFFLSLLENSSDLISIIDADGTYKFVSGSVASILGFTPEELVGNCAFRYIHEDDQNLTAAALAEALVNKVTHLPHFRFRTKAGAWRWIECTITNMVNNADIRGYVTNSRDVTERVETELRKKKTQAHYESLFYNHPDAVFELDREGLFCRINSQVSAITGYNDVQILQSHFSDLVQEDYKAEANDAFKAALNGKPQYLELAILKQNEEEAFVGITVVPVVLDNIIQSIQGIAKDITLFRKYDTVVKEQAEQLNCLMERVPVSFYSLDSNWCFTYVNSYYASYLGLEKEDLLGKNIWELFPPTLVTRFYRECLQVARTGQSVSFEEYYPGWKEIMLSIQIFPTGEGVSVHLVDVTQKKREQDQREKLSLVASKTTTCVMILDAEERIEWVNEAFEKVTGYNLEECVMKHPRDFLFGAEPLPETQTKIRRKIGHAKPFKGEILNYKKSGEKIWFNLEITPVFNAEGKLNKFIAIRTDITEKKAREEELLKVTRDVFKQNQDLQQFSYMVSHSLRAPAANVMGLTDILSIIDKNSGVFEDTLSRIKTSVSQLDTVIRDMNRILSIKENKDIFGKEEVDIAAVCQEALLGVQQELNTCQHLILTDIDKNITFLTNQDYLLEILKNLFSNAVKFRKEGQLLKLEVKAFRRKGKVELIVKDNGMGMDMEVVKPHIFKIYNKFHPGYAGRGLGLFLIKTYADALEGSIKVDSEPAIGTTFRITFENNAR